MINVSAEFRETIRSRTNFRAYATLTLADGTVLNLTPEDFPVSPGKITDAGRTATLPLGIAISRLLKLSIKNTDDRYQELDFLGARIDLRLGLPLSDGVEYVYLGEFTVTAPATYGDTVTVAAGDAMWRADRPYTPRIAFPATLGDIYMDCCTQAGVPFAPPEFAGCSREIAAAPTGYTIRQVLGHVAMLAGGNARIGWDGYMRLLRYDLCGLVSAEKHELDRWVNLASLDTDAILVTGLRTVVHGYDDEGNPSEQAVTVGQEGYLLEIENPLIAGWEEEALELIAPAVVGGAIRRFSGDYIGLPIAECMDACVVTDRRGNRFLSVLTDIDYTICGKTSLSCSAESPVREGSAYVSPAQRAVQVARQLVAAERTARQAETEALAAALANASGMYRTDLEQEDHSVISLIHDKPTLAESRNVIKVTSDAIGLSTDGGGTYPHGVMINGDLIARILSAAGVNADWLNTGRIRSLDGSVVIDLVDGTVQLASVNDQINAAVSAGAAGLRSEITAAVQDLSETMGGIYYTKEEADRQMEAVGEQIDLTQQETASAIEQSAEQIRSTVAQNYYSRGQTDSLLGTVQTTVEQNARQVELRFSSMTADLGALSESTDARFEERERYIRFVDGTVIVGVDGQSQDFRVGRTRTGYYNAGAPTTYWEAGRMVMPSDNEIPVGGSLRMGNFKWTPRSSGNLSLLYVG